MKTKTTKFIFKTLILFPFGFGLWTMINGIENFHWFFPTLIGLVVAFGVIFWNLFDYEKFNGMEMIDFLETNHKLEIQNSDKNWTQINGLIDQSIVSLKKLEKTDTSLKVEIPRKFFDSILTAERTKSGITIQIEKKGIFKFLPDNAENYRTLQKFGRELKTTANTVYN
ncbi:hypothetical protein [Maribacter aurantiacus]|uniref:Uncharacterized protein n=1 Tax=Maribacter aurantiacus TaxID=1882343 RepID=A0A5R8LR87_9FLAO|nr:hypothetical protein [Maribacter aurantiacus]TLF39752.1 hypothetical protein FEK29_17740 [Maribacter aurantiacus]